VDIGAYNPLLGQSYGEIAAESRSQHKSQGFGAATSRGQSVEYFEHVAGKEANITLMDDVDTSWGRIAETGKIQQLISKINDDFDPKRPEGVVSDLFALRKEIQHVSDEYWKRQKTQEVEELIAACAGLWIEATADRAQVAVDRQFIVNIEAIVRNPDVSTQILRVNDHIKNITLSENDIWKGQVDYRWDKLTHPYWLNNPFSGGNYDLEVSDVGSPMNVEKPGLSIVLSLSGDTLVLKRDIQFRSVDPVRGEIHQNLAVVPPLTVEAKEHSLLFTDTGAKQIELVFRNHDAQQQHYRVSVGIPDTWSVSTKIIDLDFSEKDLLTKTLSVKPEQSQAIQGALTVLLEGKPLTAIKTLNYDHIPTVTRFPTTEIQLRHVELINPVQKVGYIQGAGDLVALALANMGTEVSMLSDNQIQADYLAQFDAVVVGVRYFNVNEKSNAVLEQLLSYAKQGGVVLLQYNVNARLQTTQLGPYPFSLTRDRVTEEDANAVFDAKDPVFNYPNKISKADFDGWVQERGLYFADNIDPKYRTPLQMHDVDEPAHRGSLLITPYGNGKFVYTSLSFFRQLPAGVPGAYRLFVNLLAKEK
jgi:hypothetical protein